MKIKFKFNVKDANGHALMHAGDDLDDCTFDDDYMWGFKNFASRQWTIRNALVEGTLVVEVHMKLIDAMNSLPFIPMNPFLSNIAHNMFMDQDTADVVFEVEDEVKGGQQQGRKTRSSPKKSHVKFYAHRAVLQKCAPKLAALCGSSGDLTRVSISDVKPTIFHHQLHYIYGGKVCGGCEITFNHLIFKDIIDAAVKYGLVDLKLAAEAWYVKTLTIEVDNVKEHLLLAHTKNCALLKEAAMDFIVDKLGTLGIESFKGLPKGLLEQILEAVARGEKTVHFADGDKFSTKRVNELRKKSEEKGLPIDGSRESMIAALRKVA
jgi:hypothetical protein